MARSTAIYVRNLLYQDEAATAVEYAVMLALILMACIAMVGTLGNTVSGSFSKLNSTLSS